MNTTTRTVEPDPESNGADRVPDGREPADPVLVGRFLASAEILGWIAFVAGTAVLVVGWWLGVDIVARVIPGNVTMKANTALGISAVGLGVVAYRRDWWSWLVVTMAALVTTIGLATLFEYAADIRWAGFDNFLVSGSLGGFTSSNPERMGANVAVNLALLGFALYSLKLGRSVWLRQFLATIVALIASMALLGYSLGATDSGAPIMVAGMAVSTSVLQLALGLSLLHCDPDRGLMRLVVSNRAGGHVIRFYVPLLSGAALGIALLARHVLAPMTPDPAIALEIAVGAIVVTACFVVIIIGHDLDRVDYQREGLARIEEKLRESVRSRDELLEQRESAEKALRIVESRNRTILEAMPDQIYRLSADGFYLSFQVPDKPGFFSVPEHYIGKHIYEALPVGLADDLASASRLAKATGQNQTLEYKLEINGSIRDREARIIPVSATGEVIVIVRDITDRVNAQLALEQSLRSKNEFIASISHELRTPLTAMMGFAEVLRENPSGVSGDEQIELMQLIAQQSDHLTNIVDDLVTAAEAEAKILTVRRVRVNLGAQALWVIRAQSDEDVPPIALSGSSIQEAIGDPARVRQILRNLVSNAIEYGGDTIRVQVGGDVKCSFVSVNDSGPEIPLEVQGQMFDAYQHGNSLPGLTASMGLGLTLSRHLARLMEGDLTYRHSGDESLFELTLPTAA
jgi:signal transduction histidine kinase